MTQQRSEKILISLKRKSGLPVAAWAKKHGLNRVVVYEAAKGAGSRRARVAIALELNEDPVDLWPDRGENTLKLDRWAYREAAWKEITI